MSEERYLVKKKYSASEILYEYWMTEEVLQNIFGEEGLKQIKKMINEKPEETIRNVYYPRVGNIESLGYEIRSEQAIDKMYNKNIDSIKKRIEHHEAFCEILKKNNRNDYSVDKQIRELQNKLKFFEEKYAQTKALPVLTKV